MEIIPNFGRHRNVSSIRDDPDLVVINDDESTIYRGPSASPLNTINKRDNCNFSYPTSISTTATFHPPTFQSPEEIQVEPTLEYYQNNDDVVDYLSGNPISSIPYHSNYNHNQEIPIGGMVVTSNNEYNANSSCYSQSHQQNPVVPGFHYQEPEENFISIDDIKAKSFLFDVHKKKNNEEPKDVVIIDDDDDNDDGGDGGGEEGDNDNNNNEENKRKSDSAISEIHDDDEDDDDVILIEDDEEEIIKNEVGVELDWVAFEQEQEHEQEQDKQSYECFLCNKKVASSYNLRRHMMIHTGERPFGCDICFKRFREFSDLKKHRRVHCHEKEYKCMVCKINTPSITNPTKCSECDVEERQSRTTSNYGDILLGEVPCIEGSDRKAYVCPICDRIFGSRHNLKRHFMIHTGEKPYKCDVCEKAFREVSTLKKHMLTHSRIKLFKCTVCGREYSDFATYTRHKNASHPHQNSLININGNSLLASGNNLPTTLSTSLSSLSSSKDSSSGGSGGGNNGFVISSVRSGTGEYSAITAKRSSSLYASHANNTDLEEYLFECSDCYKKFSNASIYKEHLKLHSRDFTFQCYICKKMFRTKEKLNAHFVTHDYDEDEEERLNRLNVSRKIEYQTQLYLQQQQQRQQQQQQQFHHQN